MREHAGDDCVQHGGGESPDKSSGNCHIHIHAGLLGGIGIGRFVDASCDYAGDAPPNDQGKPAAAARLE